MASKKPLSLSDSDLKQALQNRDPSLWDSLHLRSTEATELADLIFTLGEERLSRRIAKVIHEAKQKEKITTGEQLADIIQKGVGRRGRIHPATRTFQALRMAVNHELEHLDLFLKKFPSYLTEGGRCGIVTFHSLEDRRVKRRFRELADSHKFKLVLKRVERADWEEVRQNPASRSAKLRVIERIASSN